MWPLLVTQIGVDSGYWLVSIKLVWLLSLRRTMQWSGCRVVICCVGEANEQSFS